MSGNKKIRGGKLCHTPGKHLDIHEMPTVKAKVARWRNEGTRFICTAGCTGISMGIRYQATQHY